MPTYTRRIKRQSLDYKLTHLMKLLVDCHVFDGKFQGTRTYLEGLYTHMTQHQDIEFYFAAHEEKKLENVFGSTNNIHYIHLNYKSSIKRLTIEFPQIIKKYNIEYAHFQYISPLLKKCKEIVTIHDLLFLDYPKYFPLSYKIKNRYCFMRSAKRADVLLSVSEFSKDEIARHFGIPHTRIHITNNGILPIKENIDNINLKEIYGLDKYLLYVSRIEPRKNHLSLLRAFVDLQLKNAGYKLVMVGGKDLLYRDFFDYYDSLDDETKECILFLQVPFDHLVALYRKASLFVFPSYAEGFGIPPIEAIAYGCPILCSNATAMAEFNLPEEISFDPTDINDLKHKIVKQLDMPLNRKEYKDRILSMYDWRIIASRFYEVLIENYKGHI